jgi:hypothetical protein
MPYQVTRLGSLRIHQQALTYSRQVNRSGRTIQVLQADHHKLISKKFSEAVSSLQIIVAEYHSHFYLLAQNSLKLPQVSRPELS